jgi:DNA helicase-2/ATP-dependent DNA helicase PcrA
MKKLLVGLNEKQREAVQMTEGPVMAIAGAGSGKTSVLTSRIAYLIMEKGVSPDHILALTFTNKAANEMKERINTFFSGEEGVFFRAPTWISTFHSMCVKILREHYYALGYRRSFQILDDDDTLQLVKSKLKELNMDQKMYNPREVKNYISRLKMQRMDLDSLHAGMHVVVDHVYRNYQETLKENHLMDFDDLIVNTIKLFKENDGIRQLYEDRFEYVLIDEFQDTNDIQYELVKLILGKNKNIFIVGDEDQSIYKFRGANIRNINKFKKDYKDFHLVLLEQNYRSTNNILKGANNVIKKNKTRIEKNLYSTKGDGELITHYKGTTARDEVEFVAMEIMKKVRKGATYNDFAVLYRANNISRQFEDVFMQKHIPYRIYGNTSFFKRKEIKDLTAYLRLILEGDDEVTFERVITSPKRGIGKVTLSKLFVFKQEESYTLFDAIKNGESILGKSAFKKLNEFISLIERFRELLTTVPFNEFIDHILIDSGYIEGLENDDKKEVRIENLMEFKTMLAENEKIYEEYSREDVLMFLLEEVTLKSEEKQSDVEDGVTMLTLHAAKGLEFKEVFIVNMEMGVFPTSRVESVDDLEEERRLMYVGMTRAKEKLYLTNANIRQTFGDTHKTIDSPFINEIGKELVEVQGYSVYVEQSHEQPVYKTNDKLQRANQIKRNNLDHYKENDLNKGDKVNHSKFGDGVVVSVVGDNAMIAFKSPYGVKTLLKNHKAITKL